MTSMESLSVSTDKTKEDDKAKFQRDLLNSLLNDMLDEDLEERPSGKITKELNKPIDSSRSLLSEGDAGLISGIMAFDYFGWECDIPAQTFINAESKGCTHPILYHFLIQYWCYYPQCFEDKSYPERMDPLAYCMKSISGTYSLYVHFSQAHLPSCASIVFLSPPLFSSLPISPSLCICSLSSILTTSM